MYKKTQTLRFLIATVPDWKSVLILQTTVNIQEFESQYQESVSKILNELQSMAITSNRLESSIVEVGKSVQNLNKMVEDFLRLQSHQKDDIENRLG